MNIREFESEVTSVGEYNIGFINADENSDETCFDVKKIDDLETCWKSFCQENKIQQDSVSYVELVEVGLRKVLLVGDMDHDAMLILTDAPAQDIRKWCYNYSQELENGENTYFNGLKDRYYVKVLHDSEEDAPENIEAIGYDEVYDLYN